MRKTVGGGLLIAAAWMMAGAIASAQEPMKTADAEKSRWSPSVDVAVMYSALNSNAITGEEFWTQGGEAQFHAELWHGLGLVAAVAGAHAGAVNSANAGLDLITAGFGPRYTWPARSTRLALYGQALVGEVQGFNGSFPGYGGAQSTASGLAVELGGGVNLDLRKHLAVRACEADWLRTDLPNSTTGVQNNLRVGAGLVFRIK
jgi:outer membrane immunogenic protein